jgi:DNA-binding transcriptional ArsR family regulator
MSEATTDITIGPDVPLFLLVNVVEHELRRRVLKWIIDLPNDADREDKERFAPVEISRASDLTVSNVIYHFNILKRAGMVKLVDTEQKRGATVHIYERDYVLDEHEALILRLMKEAENDKRWLSRKPSLRS